MRIVVAGCTLCAFAFLNAASVSASECPGNADALGVSRVLEIDTSEGPLFGTLQYQETLDLKPNEIVLTFDDGPHPQNTLKILAALEKECVKATFFPIGITAEKYPEIIREVAAKGHTVGAHSWSHPNLLRLPAARATSQIERGFRAIRTAVDEEIAPFFRFPGLNDSKAMKQYASTRGFAVFSTDISTDDWRGIGPSTIIQRTMSRTKRKSKGIMIFHDTKWATAKALPRLLRVLKERGYKIVHIVPKKTYASPQQANSASTAPVEKPILAGLN